MRAHQVRLIRRSPLRDRPERVHQAARTIRKLVCEPPLVAKGRMRARRHALEVSYPVIRPESFLLISSVSCLGVINSFHSGQAGCMAITALVRIIAAEALAIALLVRNCCAMDNILGPLRRS